jgi:hypothetical protein
MCTSAVVDAGTSAISQELIAQLRARLVEQLLRGEPTRHCWGYGTRGCGRTFLEGWHVSAMVPPRQQGPYWVVPNLCPRCTLPLVRAMPPSETFPHEMGAAAAKARHEILLKTIAELAVQDAVNAHRCQTCGLVHIS